MELEQARKRAAELRAVIEKNNRLYYDQDAPELEDYEYDQLTRELKTIEAQFPQLVTPDSPTQHVGGTPSGKFSKVAHAVKMESLQDAFSPPRYDALPLGFCKAEGKKERATMAFECKHDECFAGTGERFAKMDLSGQTFYLKNQDGQGVNNRRTYKNIPFYLSSRMYGVFYHTSAYAKLSLAGFSTRSVEFMSRQAMLDVFLIGGDTPDEILCGYRHLTGFPQMLPLWSYGVWMSRMTYFSADEVNDICDRMRREHYPCDVIHLDTGWFKTDWLCEWKFNEERFPDPEGFIRQLKDKGYRVTLWQLPYVAEGAEQIDEARANKYICTLTKKQESDEVAAMGLVQVGCLSEYIA